MYSFFHYSIVVTGTLQYCSDLLPTPGIHFPDVAAHPSLNMFSGCSLLSILKILFHAEYFPALMHSCVSNFLVSVSTLFLHNLQPQTCIISLNYSCPSSIFPMMVRHPVPTVLHVSVVPTLSETCSLVLTCAIFFKYN
jgi:hypothetical protein